MPMTRHQARSSFTFEIKRASRRTPEVATVVKAASGLSLADQVFGKTATGPTARIISAVGSPTPVPDIDLFKMTSQPSSVRRILPDLLTIQVDPVEERAKREAEEKARRRASRTAEVKAARQSTGRPEPVPAAVPVVEATREEQPSHRPTESVSPPSTLIETVEENAASSGSRRGRSLKAAAMRAERTGRPLPRLPAGQRWKRRLPKACW